MGKKSHMVKKVGQLQKILKISTIILKVLEKWEKNVFGHFGSKIRILQQKLGKKLEFGPSMHTRPPFLHFFEK